MKQTILSTTLVGSYPQPDWLIDRERLGQVAPPRVRMSSLWRVEPRWLDQAQDDATVLAVRDQERAGIDVVTDGEMRRESYSNRFATACAGIDMENPGSAPTRVPGHTQPVPRVIGKIRRLRPVQLRDVQFLRAQTERPIKMTVPGPFTMTQQVQNEYYSDEAAMALDYAVAVNEEIRDLFAAGANVVQIDEPYLQSYPEKARRFGLEAIERALQGVRGDTAVHTCFGYGTFIQNKPAGYSFLSELAHSAVNQISIETAQCNLDCSVLSSLSGKVIILGVIDTSTSDVETPELVADRIRRALPFVDAERIVAAPDCGMKYLSRPVAFEKMKALVRGAALIRQA
jgi:5-methyltetrahydropteroyltriglutamate--homocysteine methyltransferase